MSMRSSVCRPRPDDPSLGEEPQESPGLAGRSRPQPECWTVERVKAQSGPGDPCSGRLGCEAGALADKGAGGAAGAAVTGAGAATTAATGQGQAPASSSTSPGPRWRPPLRAGSGPGACLKQIVLLQLDLIEQQQQRIQDREREIGELRAEKDTLLARIERMERRMQLVRKDSEKDKQRTSQSREPAPEMPEGPLLESAGFGEFPLETLPHLTSLTPKPFSYGRNGKGHKRRSAFRSSDRRTPIKRLAPDLSKVKSKMPRAPAEGEDDEPGGSLSEIICQRELRSKETPEQNSSPSDTPLKSSCGLLTTPLLKDTNPLSSEVDSLPYLSTTDMYLSRWHQPPPSPLRELSPKKEECVAIPSWREHTIEPLENVNSSDIPENLDDTVFTKRHAKLELDEKRRKSICFLHRWDIQRIREQRILQRLQLRMYKKKGSQECEPEVTSFFPDHDEVESVMITPYLPVVVFGRPLPKITPHFVAASVCPLRRYIQMTTPHHLIFP
ncbi:male-specific lethal 1 homolog isoform X2 [Bombina bombina]|uniref:male-specific lethal 1 homolog isoform X2 n=1 Tax=Bombina bombina TaxID=8345 RepID=UPI00235B179F|nr:male-specific lethal 1 homolog isoform X2 [Bombina bombina]